MIIPCGHIDKLIRQWGSVNLNKPMFLNNAHGEHLWEQLEFFSEYVKANAGLQMQNAADSWQCQWHNQQELPYMESSAWVVYAILLYGEARPNPHCPRGPPYEERQSERTSSVECSVVSKWRVLRYGLFQNGSLCPFATKECTFS